MDAYRLLEALRIDVQQFAYVAPERFAVAVVEALEEGAPDTGFKQQTYAEFRALFGDAAPQHINALCVLYRYKQSFMDRMTGARTDDWLSKATFGNLAAAAVAVLDLYEASIPPLADWQVKLRDTFRAMLE